MRTPPFGWVPTYAYVHTRGSLVHTTLRDYEEQDGLKDLVNTNLEYTGLIPLIILLIETGYI